MAQHEKSPIRKQTDLLVDLAIKDAERSQREAKRNKPEPEKPAGYFTDRIGAKTFGGPKTKEHARSVLQRIIDAVRRR